MARLIRKPAPNSLWRLRALENRQPRIEPLFELG